MLFLCLCVGRNNIVLDDLYHGDIVGVLGKHTPQDDSCQVSLSIRSQPLELLGHELQYCSLHELPLAQDASFQFVFPFPPLRCSSSFGILNVTETVPVSVIEIVGVPQDALLLFLSSSGQMQLHGE